MLSRMFKILGKRYGGHGVGGGLWIIVCGLSVCCRSVEAGVGLSQVRERSFTKEFGEACNKVEICNHRYWLKCRNGSCACLTSSLEMVYLAGSQPLGFFASYASHFEAKSCRARVGFECARKYFYNDEGKAEGAGWLTRPQDMSTGRQTQLCVPNAFCHPHGQCKCLPEFVLKLEDGRCERMRLYGEACEADRDCHRYKFLKCGAGICGCDKGMRYERESGKCVVGPGEKCQLSLSWSQKIIHSCARNGSCYLEKCVCSRGYIPDYERRACVRDYGYSCDREHPCLDNERGEYICINSSCVCNQYPEISVFDELKRRCVQIYKSGARRNTPPGGGSSSYLRMFLSLWINMGFFRSF